VRYSIGLLLLAALLGGCAMGGRDTSEPPAELVQIDSQLEVRRVWRSKVGGGFDRLRLGLRPASDGERVFAGAHDGQVVAYDAETGRRQWAVRTRMPLSAGPGYGDGLLVFGTADGHLLALDAETGEELWRRPVGSEVLAPPAVAPNAIVLRTVDGRLRGFARRDGATLWAVEQSTPTLSLRGNTPPRIAGSVVVSGFDNGRLGAYQLSNGDALWEIAVATPTGATDIDRLVDISGGLEVVDNDVYAASYNGRAVSVDLITGQPLWQQDLSSFAGLGADRNYVYVSDHVGAVVALNRRTGSPVWRQEALRLRDVTAPAWYRDTLVVGDYDGYLHWLDPSDGSFLARHRAASKRITAPPLVVGDKLFVQAEDSTVAAYRLVVETDEDLTT
jgi:outer membrane protein assembly factor BamB